MGLLSFKTPRKVKRKEPRSEGKGTLYTLIVAYLEGEVNIICAKWRTFFHFYSSYAEKLVRSKFEPKNMEGGKGKES